MITVNKPFESIAPLIDYLVPLEQMTADPFDAAAREELQRKDSILTSKAVLFPNLQYVHGEGYRTYGYEPCTISDGVDHVAQYVRGELTPEPGRERVATMDALRRQSRGALIVLGGHMAVSGAFHEHDMQSAFEAVKESMQAIGSKSDDPEEFVRFGLKRTGVELLNNYVKLSRYSRYEFPIGSKEARHNIEAGWRVLGKPYGVWTKVFGYIHGSDL